MSQSPSPGNPSGRLYIIGIGPGSPDMITEQARSALRAASVIIGNGFYLDQIPALTEGKTIIRSSMGREVDRARKAVEEATDKVVAMVSGGDAGIYGMASIVLEVAGHLSPGLIVEVIPGITAASAGASLLGSPLSGDFAVISLSDLLTPWDVIEQRLAAISSVAIPIVLYNPKSRTRTDQFSRAVAVIRKNLKDNVPVGIVRNAGREGQTVLVTRLGEVEEYEDEIDMHTVVFIGGEESRPVLSGDHATGIITPRGYHRKYVY